MATITTTIEFDSYVATGVRLSEAETGTLADCRGGNLHGAIGADPRGRLHIVRAAFGGDEWSTAT